MALPNLSGLQPAGAPTGPYVDVLRDGESCPLLMEDFDGGHSMNLRGPHVSIYRRADAYRSGVGCDKAWQPLTWETDSLGQRTGRTILEQDYYDTVQLALWLLNNDTSPATRRKFVPQDRNACLAKAAELVEEQGWASLMAYKAARSRQQAQPPPPPQPRPPPRGSERGAGAAREALEAEFMAYGEQMLNRLIGQGSPLHYGQILNMVDLDRLGRIRFADPGSPAWNTMRAGLAEAGFVDTRHVEKPMAVVWAAYEDYKNALDIDAWDTYVKRPDQNWWEYWEAVMDGDTRRAVDARRASTVRNALTIGELRGYAQVATSRLRTFPPLIAASHSGTNLEEMARAGWTPAMLVARSTLTLWLMVWYDVFFLYRPSPEDETGALSILDSLPDQYATVVMARPMMRIRP